MIDAMRALATAGVAAGMVALSGAAEAQYKWTMTGNSDCGTASACLSGVGNTRSFNSAPSGGPSVTASAWSNTGATPTAGSISPPTLPGGTLETAYLGLYSGGLGVKNRDGAGSGVNTGDGSEYVAPEHSVDNESRYDSVLFSFASAVKLTQVEIGYTGGDSDITVLAYTGAGTPTLAGKSYGNLISQGWSFIGNYTDLAVGSARSVNGGGVSSMYWLIGAYVPGFDASTYTLGNDYVKLLALYGDKPTTRVPEPNALLLLGIAMAGMWVTRRRRGKA